LQGQPDILQAGEPRLDPANGQVALGGVLNAIDCVGGVLDSDLFS
jgi:hypothetical protein